MKAIVLAGGSGTRLWPLSRKLFPKQFLNLNGKDSLLSTTIKRLLRTFSPEDIVILTNNEYRFHVIDSVKSISEDLTRNIILEPKKKNTAPAISLAARYCLEKLNCPENEVLFISPSDHIIEPVEKFSDYLKQAEEIAREGYLLTFGVKPTRAETGYGYIKADEQKNGAFIVESFKEKPDLMTAEKYLKEGHYFWNSGMFAFRTDRLLEELKNHAGEIYDLSSKSFDDMMASFERMPEISIDYAVMEKSDRVSMLPLEIYWNDIGSWDSLFEVFDSDQTGNIKIGDVIAVDSEDSLILGSKRLIATIGIKNLLIIETDDALLVTKRGDAQQVREVVKELEGKGRREAQEHVTIHRPWGNYTLLEEGPRYKIKRILVNQEEKLSLQMHHHRSEHWVVIRGTAKVTLNGQTLYVHENESTYIPKSTLHRLENPGKVPLEIIEVQNGEYVEEDDIQRFDDDYGRETKNDRA